MAPIDRAEHRQQRMRGAGVANVQTNFSFLAGLGSARQARQPSLPPQRPSGRRSATPAARTPSAQGSARRRRSVSAPRSTTKRRSKSRTPGPDVATPQLGKRKRGSKDAASTSIEEDDEVDELSPDHDHPKTAKTPASIERSRRAAPTVSPIREEREGSPDELSFVGGMTSSIRKAIPEPDSTVETTIMEAGRERTNTPASVGATSNLRNKSPTVRAIMTLAEPYPESPSAPFQRQDKVRRTPPAEQNAEESEDELSPPKVDTAPARRSKTTSPQPLVQDDEEMDELSPEAPKGTRIQPPLSPLAEIAETQEADTQEAETQEAEPTPPQPRKRGQPARVVETEEDTAQTALAAKSAPAPEKPRQRRQRRDVQEREESVHSAAAVKAISKARKQKKPSRNVPEEEEDIMQSTSAPDQARRPKSSRAEEPEPEIEDEEMMDELSFEDPHTRREEARRQSTQKKSKASQASEGHLDDYEEHFEEDEEQDGQPSFQSAQPPRPKPRPQPKHKPSTQSQSQSQSQPDAPPPEKRQKRGPTQIIQVMRLEGFKTKTKALTVVDTTRTVVEEWTARRINRLDAQASNIPDRTAARPFRRRANVVRMYREKLDDMLLELQDANNTATEQSGKLRALGKENRGLRNEYLASQRERDQLAVEFDDVMEGFEREKREVEAKETLSSSLWDLQAAVRSGKEKAKDEGREGEGPVVPLRMLMEDLKRGFGKDGMLGRVRAFNGVLDNAARALEGRV